MNKVKIEVSGSNSVVVITIITANIKDNKTMIMGKDCEVLIYTLNTPSFTGPEYRTISIINKYNGKNLAIVNSTTLDSGSTSYNADMDIYFTNLQTILFS